MDEEVQSAVHRQAWHVIPWVVNGTASEADQDMVRDHAALCEDCSEELAVQRGVFEAMAQADGHPMHDAGPALARFWGRVDQDDLLSSLDEPVPLRGAPRAGSVRWTRILAAAVVVQAVGLTALSGMLWQQRAATAPGYVTLSQPPPVSEPATIRLVPEPSLRLSELQALLKASGLRIVQSNEDGSILGVAPLPQDSPTVADAVLRLKGHPGVLLAEPVTAVAP